MRPSATSVSGLELLVYEALSYYCMRPWATSVCGLQLLVYEADTRLKEERLAYTSTVGPHTLLP